MTQKLKQKDVFAIDQDIIDRLIRMAWEDDVPFETIKDQFGYDENQVIKIMKIIMKPKMFNVWRQRVSGRPEKHFKKMRFLEKQYSGKI